MSTSRRPPRSDDRAGYAAKRWIRPTERRLCSALAQEVFRFEEQKKRPQVETTISQAKKKGAEEDVVARREGRE